MNLTRFILPLFTGLASGMVAYLSASGLSLVMCGMGTVNFGQGAFYILGTLLSYTAMKTLGLSIWAAMCIGFLVTFLLGAVVEFLLRPLQGKNMIFSMLVTMGVCYILCDTMMFIWGSDIKTTAAPR